MAGLSLNSHLRKKESHLVTCIRQLESVIVAYSGGVDSSLLSYYAKRELQERALIVIAVSPSLAKSELAAARQQALDFNWDLLELATGEVDREDYRKNDLMRCYFCKATLFEDLQTLAKKRGIKSIAYGANLDDLSDFRPGHTAAREFTVLSPLQSAQLSKEEIRTLAKESGLPSWNRPQAACLSSRFPTDIPVTIEGLDQVERAEDFIRTLGFSFVRVRHHVAKASVEVPLDELHRFDDEPELLKAMTQALSAIGFAEVEVDQNGYRQGSVSGVAK